MRAINSVFAQTIVNYELIIVNDGSTDHGPDLIRNLSDTRIRLFDQPNAGVSAARNRGIHEAKADLIAFLDADDAWDPRFLETILRMRKTFASADVFATGYFFCSSRSQQKRPAIIRGLDRGFKEGIIDSYFNIASRSDPPLWTSAVAVTIKAIKSVRGFPPGITTGEDLLTWARLALLYKIAYCRSPLALHWNPDTTRDRFNRQPQYPDVVREQLILLAKRKTPGINNYIALWHRMRANMLLQSGKMKDARKEIKEALSLERSNPVLYLYLFLTILPTAVFSQCRKIINRYRYRLSR